MTDQPTDATDPQRRDAQDRRTEAPAIQWGTPPTFQERAAAERRMTMMTTLEEERRMLADRRLATAS